MINTYEVTRVAHQGRTTKASRLFVSLEETVLENLVNRRNRDIAQMRRYAMDGIRQFKTMQAASKTPLADVKLRWSQKAGCSCGCSPGFILDRRLWAQDIGYYDLHVTVCDLTARALKQALESAPETEDELLAKYG